MERRLVALVVLGLIGCSADLPTEDPEPVGSRPPSAVAITSAWEEVGSTGNLPLADSAVITIPDFASVDSALLAMLAGSSGPVVVELQGALTFAGQPIALGEVLNDDGAAYWRWWSIQTSAALDPDHPPEPPPGTTFAYGAGESEWLRLRLVEGAGANTQDFPLVSRTANQVRVRREHPGAGALRLRAEHGGREFYGVFVGGSNVIYNRYWEWFAEDWNSLGCFATFDRATGEALTCIPFPPEDRRLIATQGGANDYLDVIGLAGTITVKVYREASAPPAATLACTPNIVVRADSSTCTLSLQGADSGRVLDWTSQRDGASIAAPLIGVYIADSARWGGRIVAPTSLEAKVIAFSGGKADTLIVRDSVQVTARIWQVLIPKPAIVINAAPAYVGMTAEPTSYPTPTSTRWSFKLGVNVINNFDFWDPNGARVDSVKTGPNSGLWYIRSIPATMADTIYLHPQLLRQPCGQWCREQNGQDTSLLPRECTQSDFPSLRAAAGGHEGVGSSPMSHWGNMSTYYAAPLLQNKVEGIITRLSEAQLRYVGDSIVRTLVVDPRHTADSTLDAHYSAVWQVAGCQPDAVMDGH